MKKAAKKPAITSKDASKSKSEATNLEKPKILVGSFGSLMKKGKVDTAKEEEKVQPKKPLGAGLKKPLGAGLRLNKNAVKKDEPKEF